LNSPLFTRNKENENPLFTTHCNEGGGDVNKTDFNKQAKILFSVDRKYGAKFKIT